jgi:hypothetical protein
MWNENQIAYLAGIMDGEGSFYIGRDHRREKCFNSRLYVVNTDERLIKWLQENFTGLTYSRTSPKNPKWKMKYEWVARKSEILPICEAIYPFLICKREQAEVMIKFRETFKERRGARHSVPSETHDLRLNLLSQLSKLNHRSSI